MPLSFNNNPDSMGAPMQAPANSIDRASTEQMLIEGAPSEEDDALYVDANPVFDATGEQRLSEIFDPGPAPMMEMSALPMMEMGTVTSGQMPAEAPTELAGEDRAGMHQALVDQMATMKQNSEGYQDGIIQQNKQTTKPYNM